MERFASFHTLGFLDNRVHLGTSFLLRSWMSMHFARICSLSNVKTPTESQHTQSKTERSAQEILTTTLGQSEPSVLKYERARGYGEDHGSKGFYGGGIFRQFGEGPEEQTVRKCSKHNVGNMGLRDDLDCHMMVNLLAVLF